eukprot:COSAG01_NODE_4928_length_4613_cov_24.277741_7_plen_76_part_00
MKSRRLPGRGAILGIAGILGILGIVVLLEENPYRPARYRVRVAGVEVRSGWGVCTDPAHVTRCLARIARGGTGAI